MLTALSEQDHLIGSDGFWVSDVLHTDEQYFNISSVFCVFM